MRKSRPRGWSSRDDHPGPPLADTLSVILPDREKTLLLRACLLGGDSGREAWREWLTQAADPARRLSEYGSAAQAYLLLLASAIEHHGFEPDPVLLDIVQAAHRYEQQHDAAYQRLCRQVVHALTADGVPAIALQAAALKSTVYPDGALLRAAHQMDLLVQPRDLHRTTEALTMLGVRRLRPQSCSEYGEIELEHVSGWRVRLFSRPFRAPYANALLPGFWERSRIETVADVPTRVLSPADSLVHVCGEAAQSESLQSMRWVADAWQLIRACPELNWQVVIEDAARAQLALPLFVMISYLATELDADVPDAVLSALATGAARSRAIGREGALHGARVGSRATFGELLRRSRDKHSRVRLLQWMLVPSPTYVRWIDELEHDWLLPLYYLYRPLRFGSRRIGPRGR